jgi:hypothetical protein
VKRTSRPTAEYSQQHNWRTLATLRAIVLFGDAPVSNALLGIGGKT